MPYDYSQLLNRFCEYEASEAVSIQNTHKLFLRACDNLWRLEFRVYPYIGKQKQHSHNVDADLEMSIEYDAILDYFRHSDARENKVLHE
jgi:hypothetical protein